MRIPRSRYVVIACLSLLWPSFLGASEPSYWSFSLDFVKPLQPGQPNEIEAKFVIYSNCLNGDLTITVPNIGNDSTIAVRTWSGAVEARNPVVATISVPALPEGAYCFRAEFAVVDCDDLTPVKCEAALSAWVTAGGAISRPIGFQPNGLEYILNEIEAADLSALTLDELRSKAPDLYKVLTFDPRVPSSGSADPSADTFMIAPRTPPTPEVRPVKRLGTIQGVAGEPDSAWQALSKPERDSIGLYEWYRRSDSVLRFGTPVPVELNAGRTSSGAGGLKQAPAPERTAPDTLAIRKWKEEAKMRRDSLQMLDGDQPR